MAWMGAIPRPAASPLPLPRDYGVAKDPMDWGEVSERLAEARVYWLATARPDGRPHVVPSDGIWLDDGLYFGGGPETVHMRNVRANPRVAAHVGDGLAVTIVVEGTASFETPDRDVAARLADANNTKYADYGMTLTPDDYVKLGVTVLRPERVLAWTRFPDNATRFTFRVNA
jgi:Pyridoxamine 5'-phosphate oxidase